MGDLSLAPATDVTPSPQAIRRQKIFLQNIRANSLISQTCQVHDLVGQFKGTPVLLVGAGPSTQKYGEAIRDFVSAVPCVTLCVDRAWPMLAAHGVRANGVVCIDYQAEVADFFKGEDLSDVVVFANSTAHPETVARFGIRIFYHTNGIVIPGPDGGPDLTLKTEDMIEAEALMPYCSRILLTPSLVGGEALLVADMLEFDPIILIGYDCAGMRGPAPGPLAGLAAWIEGDALPMMRTRRPGLRVWNCSIRDTVSRGVELLDLGTAQVRLT